MSEPTPLSAEQPYSRDELVHLAENMRHPTVQQIVGATGQKTINRLLATIDAQATEIAALKGALAAVIPWIDGEPRDRAYRMALLRYNDSAGGGTETDVLNELERQRQVVFRAARVLAGKEAQGGD